MQHIVSYNFPIPNKEECKSNKNNSLAKTTKKQQYISQQGNVYRKTASKLVYREHG